MMTLFDRYLMTRYWHAFWITFAAMLGLFVVIDMFTNIDEFTKQGKPVTAVVLDMSQYYFYRACAFFDTVGTVISYLAAMMVLAVIQRHGELSPILSAGIPTYRLAKPMVLSTMFISALLVINQELVIPRFANELQLRPGQDATSSDKIKPVYDFSTGLLIAGGRLFFRTGKLSETEFVLPTPEIAHELTTIHSTNATYRRRPDLKRSGWILQGAEPKFDEISLTPLGRETVFPGEGPDELFIATDIGLDQLMGQNKSYAFLSTRELLDRVRNPAYAAVSIRGQSLQLHTRFTRPLLNVLGVLLIVPLIVRGESRSLVTNIALCIFAMLLQVGLTEAFHYLGTARVVRLDLAAWLPVIVSGTTAAWLSGLIRT